MEQLLDPHMHKIISSCFINKKHADEATIFVIYSDGTRENIWTYNTLRYDFTHHEFLGKTKIEAVFYCDRKEPRSVLVR